MKKARIALIAALCMITVGLCVLFAYGMKGGSLYNLFYHTDQPYSPNIQVVLEEEISLDGIDSISILYGMNDNDIYIYESPSDTVLIKEYGNSEMSEDQLSTIEVNGSSLEVKGRGRSYNIGFHMFYFNSGYYLRHYTEIFLPASYHGELLLKTASGDIVSDFDITLEKDISISSTSGDISFPSVTAANAAVTTTSGNVTLETIQTGIDGSMGKIDVETTSGDIHITELNGETKIESTSGYQTLGTITGDTQLKTTSGDIRVTEIAGTANVECSSGNVTADSLSGSTQVSTSSGDVDIHYLEGDLQLSTTAGYANVLEGSGERTVSTSSGDITIKGTDGNFQVNTLSGNVLISLQNASGNIKTTSGEIFLELEELSGALNVNSSSGDVNMELSDKNEFEFEAETTSGRIETFFDNSLHISPDKDYAHGTYGSNVSEKQIVVRTSSGDVTVLKIR